MKLLSALLLLTLGLTITPLHNTNDLTTTPLHEPNGDCHTPYEEPTKANECRHKCDHIFCNCKDQCFKNCKDNECVYYCIYDKCLGKHVKCFNKCNDLEEE